MSEFTVKPQKIKEEARSENNLSSQVRKIGQQTERILSQLSLQTSAAVPLKQSLRTIVSQIDDEKQKLSAYASVLEQTASLYAAAEDRISGQRSHSSGGGRHDNGGSRSMIDKLRQETEELLRKTKKILGLDQGSSFSSDPVNLCNGNFVYENIFFGFDTGISVNLRLFYNIQDKRKGVLGTGWTHNFERHLVHEDDRIEILKEDGSKENFILTEEGVWLSCAGTFGDLKLLEEAELKDEPTCLQKFISAAKYRFLDQEHDCYYFDAAGRFLAAGMRDVEDAVVLEYQDNQLRKVVHNKGVELSFVYDQDGMLTSVTDHTGRTVALGYKNGMLSEIWDPEDQHISYQYDEKNRLIQVINAKGMEAVRNTYDEEDRTVSQVFPDGGIVTYDYSRMDRVSMTQQNGNVITYIHDDQYRNTETVYFDGTEKFTYNGSHQKIAAVDKLGRENRYEYNENGNLTAFENALGQRMEIVYTRDEQPQDLYVEGQKLHHAEYDEKHHQISSTDACGNTEFYEYDTAGHVTAITHQDGSVTRLTYDLYGNILSVEDPRNGHIDYEYDERRRLISTTDALGNKTTYAYDNMDRMIRMTNAENRSRTCEYDPCGNLIKCIDFNNGITVVEYNELNLPAKVTDPDGHKTIFRYDQMGNIIQRETDDGAVTCFEYDPLNRRIATKYPNGTVERAEYDACGNLIRRIRQDGSVYSMEYDALNRPVVITDPVGMVRSVEYDTFGNEVRVHHGEGITEEFEYDLTGNCVAYTDKSGYTQQYSYNALGDMTEVSDDQGWIRRYTYYPGGLLKTETYADGQSKEYRYDAIGNILEITDQGGNRWLFDYDVLGRVIRAEHEGDLFESYEYDAMDHIVAVTDACGNRTAYQYSAAGSLTGVIDANGTETRYEYDPCYRLTKILQPEGGHFDASALNEFNSSQKEIRITSYQRDLMGNVTKIVDPEGNTTEMEYDLCGRLIARKDADGYLTRCEYNADDTENRILFSDGREIQYHYNPVKQLVRLQDWLGSMEIERDAAGRVVSVKDQKSKVVEYQYDDRGDMTKLTYPNGMEVNYSYDRLGRLTHLDSENVKAQYAYYDNGKLKRRSVSNGLCSEYTYDKAGRIASICHSMNGKQTDLLSYSYDVCGRKSRISRLQEGMEEPVINDYLYTSLGSLSCVRSNGKAIQEYEYDIFGNRTIQRQNDKIIRYVYNRNNELTCREDENGLAEYRYDGRGNLNEIIENGVSTLRLRFDELNYLTEAQGKHGSAIYEYNGLAMRVGMHGELESGPVKEEYLPNFAQQGLGFGENDGYGCLLSWYRNGQTENIMWDHEILGLESERSVAFFLNDERMSPIRILDTEKSLCSYHYDAFGVQKKEQDHSAFMRDQMTFTGYRTDPVTGFAHARAREYDSQTGRFISQDQVAGSLLAPMTLNSYLYCNSDPLNQIDPTGMIVAWLAGGIVGSVVSVTTRFAGDVVNSVKKGKWTPSSWQDYVGDAAGGFVEGSVLVVAGPAAAGAAGGATRTLVSNGLKMATGVEGYRKEDGYTAKNLLWDTTKSTITGAAEGFVFGKAAEYIKIPGITSGKGNYSAVWKQVMTKAQRGIIENVTMRTMMKGLVAYGIIRPADKILKGLYEYGKEKVVDWIKDKAFGPDGRFPMQSMPASIKNAFGGRNHARCPLAA